MTPTLGSVADLLSAAGPWVYPLAAVALCLLGGAIRAALTIAGSAGIMPASGPPHHSIIVWGVLGLVVGLLGTVIGFARVAVGARSAAGGDFSDFEAMLTVLWDGVLVIMTPVTLGLWLFTMSLVVWLVLDWVLKRKVR